MFVTITRSSLDVFGERAEVTASFFSGGMDARSNLEMSTMDRAGARRRQGERHVLF